MHEARALMDYQPDFGRSLAQVIDRLPARERAVVLLHLFGDATYREIADIFGVSQRTVAVHLARGYRRLRQLEIAETVG